MRVGIVGTDLAPLDPQVGALEKLCLGWASQLQILGLQVVLFSVSHRRKTLSESHQFTLFEDQDDLDYKIGLAKLDAVIVNNRPMWQFGDPKTRINVFHNYPDAWNADHDEDLSGRLESARNLAVSTALANEINGLFPAAKAGVLYPFIDECFLESCLQRPADHERRPSDTIRVLFPNRTLEKKGLRWLIDSIDNHLCGKVSLSVVRNISPWTRETSEHSGLLGLAASRSYVRLLPKARTIEDLMNLYRSHDVVVTPSVRAEGLGLIPLEAQALGLPVVASDLGGLKESVFPPNLTVPVGSTKQLARAIISAAHSTQAEREAARQQVIEKFSAAESARQLMSEIRALLDSDGLG